MTTEGTLSEPFARVIHRVTAWWTPPPLPPRIPRTLVWGGRDLSAHARTLLVDGPHLHVELVSRTPAEKLGRGRTVLEELWKQPLEGQAEDGWRFAARQAVVTNWTPSLNRDQEESVHVRGWDWTLVSETGRSRYWVAEITGDPPVYIGNLTLTSGKHAFSRGHYFLTGPECDYALVRQGREKDRWLLVVYERAPDALTHSVLRRDLNALSFAFGTPLGVGHVWSVDEDLRSQAVLGGDIATRARKGMSEEAPVPSTNDLHALPAVMFEKLAAYLAARSDEEVARLTLASWYYLESLAEVSAEGALVKIALAAVVMARDLLNNDLVLAVDGDAFRAWVTTADVELSAHERPERPGALRAQVAQANQASPSTAIRLAVEHVGLALAPEIAEALAAAEQSLAGKEGARTRFYENFARIRTLLAALVARAVGYTGRLSGWERSGEFSFYEPAPAEWWPADESVCASFYKAAAPEETADVAALWPTVEVPTVPRSGVLGLLARHAAGLASRTDGRVYADLQPLPLDSSGDERRYELALRASSRPATKITLFIARPSGDDVAIEGWDESVTLRTASDVERFLSKLKTAPETSASIERLLLISLEASRRGAS